MVRAVLRTKSVTTKLTETEYARLEELAGASGVNLSEWVRGKLLGPDRPGSGTEVLLGEVLALRTILMNLLFSISNGKPVTPESMKKLIERADGDKVRRAVERLAAVRAAVPEAHPEGGAEPEVSAEMEVGEGA